jgi:uncharacterized membrane protein YjjP (DUF1212 family)
MRRNLDQIVNKYISRKLVVFAVGSWGLFSGTLNSGDWVIIATAYISSQALVDIVERLMRVKNNTN